MALCGVALCGLALCGVALCGAADRHFSERAGADQCARDDGYNSRGHRFGQFYDKLCCACATKRGFDLTIANHGGACGNCLARNIQDLSAHPHLHLDMLCAKLSNSTMPLWRAARSQRVATARQ